MHSGSFKAGRRLSQAGGWQVGREEFVWEVRKSGMDVVHAGLQAAGSRALPSNSNASGGLKGGINRHAPQLNSADNHKAQVRVSAGRRQGARRGRAEACQTCRPAAPAAWLGAAPRHAQRGCSGLCPAASQRLPVHRCWGRRPSRSQGPAAVAAKAGTRGEATPHLRHRCCAARHRPPAPPPQPCMQPPGVCGQHREGQEGHSAAQHDRSPALCAAGAVPR